MIKWPEPNIKACHCHSTQQLKQAVRDVLELAFQVAGPEDSYQDEHFKAKAKADSATRIRALIKEVDAPKQEDYPEAYDERFSL